MFLKAWNPNVRLHQTESMDEAVSAQNYFHADARKSQGGSFLSATLLSCRTLLIWAAPPFSAWFGEHGGGHRQHPTAAACCGCHRPAPARWWTENWVLQSSRAGQTLELLVPQVCLDNGAQKAVEDGDEFYKANKVKATKFQFGWSATSKRDNNKILA